MALVPSYIEALRPYEPGRRADEARRLYGITDVIKLASNENPLGPSPLALEAIQREAASVHLYPDGGLRLRERLAEIYAAKVDNVIAGSGSEGIMANIVRTFLLDDDEVLASEASFAAFRVLVQARGVAYREVPHRDYHLDLDAIAEAITGRTKIVYLANPNNPTGTIFTRQEFDRFYKHVPERVLIILDEAYIEYARDNPVYPDSMFYRYDNVITLRTFSKVYGLAGLRIGYGFAHESLISNLLKVKLPFEPNSLALAAAVAALDDTEFLHRSLALNARTLRLLSQGLTRLGLRVIPSSANFVMVVLDNAEMARVAAEELFRQGVIIRSLNGFGLPHCVRISTGTEAQTQRLTGSLAGVLEQAASALKGG